MTTKISSDNIQSATLNTLGGPKITTIGYPGDDTAADPAGGQTITLTGSGFEAGAGVIINNITVGVVSVVSANTITFTSPALATGSYPVYVVNTNGGTAIAVPGIQYSGVPTWSTAAGSIGSVYETTNFANTVTATSDSTITYSLYSGTLPTGASLNSANGLISGTSVATASPTTFTFTIRATDLEQQETDRQFNLTVNPDVVTWSSPANNATLTANTDVVMANVTLSATSAAGYGITYTANTLPTGLSISGANIVGTPTVAANTTTLLTATAATTNRTATRTVNWVISVSNDQYFNYTTLLLNGEVQSTNVWNDDASTNKFAITVNGDTKPVSFSPYLTQYSAYFDGSDDYVGFPNGTAVQFSTGHFTIECFVYRDSTGPAYPVIFANTPGDGGSGGEFTHYMIHPAGNNLLYAGGTYTSGGTPPTANKWSHFVLCRDGTSTRCYVDGVQQWEATSGSIFTATYGLASGTFTIGVRTANVGQTSTKGYISNFRVTKGQCLYTGTTFAIPTSTLTAGVNTSVLTLQSARFLDNSTSALTITGYNNTTISNFTPFTETDLVTGSGYFDGTGDYLNTGIESGLYLNGVDYTIEFWAYFTRAPGTANAGTLQCPLAQGDGAWSGGATEHNWYFLFQSAQLDIGKYPGQYTLSYTTPLYVWTHYAIVGTSTNSMTLYINGVSQGTQTGKTPITGNSWSTRIGLGYFGDSKVANYFQGYLSNIRIVKGSQVYTGNFTPPTSPLTAIANTALLTLQSRTGENNNRFIDTSGINNTITRSGNSTQGTFSPFSQTGWSVSFNGSNDNVVLSATTSLNIESVDFTIEAWIYMNVMPTATSTTNWSGDWAQWFVIYERSNGGSTGWQFRVGATLLTLGGDGDNSIAWGTHGMTTNTWYHVAVSRASSTYRIFVNGTSLSLTTQAVSMATSGSYYIGSEDTSGANFNGYISNLRVIKGQAIYTGAFTPSTTPLTPVTIGSTGAGVAASLTGLTSLLTCNNCSFIDYSANNNTISRTGTNTAVTAFSAFTPSIGTPTSYSAYFDGTGDNIQIPYTASLSPGTAAYCFEVWVYFVGSGANQGIIGTTSDGFAGFERSSGNWAYYYGTGGVGTGVAAPIDQWHHVVICRNGSGAGAFFVNGTRLATFTDTANKVNFGNLQVGYNGVAGGAFTNGYISNYRYVNGATPYDPTLATLTVPTSPLTAIANTNVLTLQSSRIVDNSTNNFTITVNGDTVPRSFNPFGSTYQTGINAAYSLANVGGSMYFDGSGDYLTTSYTVNWSAIGSYSLEFWMYPTTLAGSGAVWFASIGTGGTGNLLFYVYQVSAGNPASLALGINGTNEIRSANNLIRAGTWYHVAYTYDGTNTRIYLNGLQVATSTTGVYPNNSGTFNIGGGSTGGAGFFNGYISDMRLLRYVRAYTSNFAPPASPLTQIAGTYLLVSGTNGGIIDYTSKNDLETFADIKTSNAVVKYGTRSLYFDGTGDYLTFLNNNTTQFGTNNFTIECWSYLISRVNGYPAIFSNYNSFTTGALALFAGHGSADTTKYQVASSGTFPAIQSTTSISYNSWVHLAVVRNNNVLTLYVNGVANGTVNVTGTNFTGVGTLWYIGTTGDSIASGYINGYIDDLRITKGYARYTTNFTPPTALLTY